ncbi:unnamed protein product [Ceratitis capitata]|uniref:(Mediterranean fruit fly) hypothetical protein n=1 Tax=Ceratitis capitata TaxID=7213 RepID=A0A811U267_CERCA|nr:unnamed protein product [Ceratitis capitata]
MYNFSELLDEINWQRLNQIWRDFGKQCELVVANGSITDCVSHARHGPSGQSLLEQIPTNGFDNEPILGLFTLVLLLISACGNGVVVYIFGGTKSLRTPANLLVLNLAFSDFCMMVSQAPVMIINFYYETWILGPLWCDIYSICGSMFGCVSIWSMCMIALDRYNVIVKGVSGRPMTINWR